jgi:predicted DNA repair protein MutK
LSNYRGLALRGGGERRGEKTRNAKDEIQVEVEVVEVDWVRVPVRVEGLVGVEVKMRDCGVRLAQLMG